ncbi:MAG: DUF6094 domain-containing protein [Thermodesulfovibrionales bacterium]|jgi:SAM-dependent methyltransferase
MQTITTFSRTAHNLINMGYYPTSQTDCEIIASYLTSDYGAVLLDPCCGTGAAVKTVAKEIRGGSKYCLGVEVEESRAESAAESLDLVVTEDFFSLQIEAGSVGCVFLNPPYYSQEELHQSFIEKATRILTKKGVLILLIPEYELKGKTTAFLASYFEDIRVFKTVDKTFQQTILFGVKKAKIERAEEDALGAVCDELQTIKKTSQPLYRIPYTKRYEEIKIVSTALTAKYLQQVCYSFTDDTMRIQELVPERHGLRRPILPLRRGHLAQVLASGAIDGVVTHPDTKERFLIKGTTTRNEETIEEFANEDDDKIVRTITRDVVTILIMDQKGNISHIK